MSQVLTSKNMFPGPFIEMYCKDGEEIRMDLYGKTVDEIIEHLKSSICSTAVSRKENFATELNTHLRELVRQDKDFSTHELLENPAHFGWMCKRQCICQEFGQVGQVPVSECLCFLKCMFLSMRLPVCLWDFCVVSLYSWLVF